MFLHATQILVEILMYSHRSVEMTIQTDYGTVEYESKDLLIFPENPRYVLSYPAHPSIACLYSVLNQEKYANCPDYA